MATKEVDKVQFYTLLFAAIGKGFFDEIRDVLMARKWLRQSAGLTPALVLKAAPELLRVAVEYTDQGHDCDQSHWREQMVALSDWLIHQDEDLQASGLLIGTIASKSKMLSEDMMTLFRALSELVYTLGMLMHTEVKARQPIPNAARAR